MFGYPYEYNIVWISLVSVRVVWEARGMRAIKQQVGVWRSVAVVMLVGGQRFPERAPRNPFAGQDAPTRLV